MAELNQPPRELRRALRSPPQRRLRITARAVLQQPPQILLDRRVGVPDRLVPSTRPPDPTTLERLATLKLLTTPPHRRLPNIGRAHNRRDPTPPRRPSLDRRTLTAVGLVADIGDFAALSPSRGHAARLPAAPAVAAPAPNSRADHRPDALPVVQHPLRGAPRPARARSANRRRRLNADRLTAPLLFAPG
jgi:hypothetical protein